MPPLIVVQNHMSRKLNLTYRDVDLEISARKKLANCTNQESQGFYTISRSLHSISMGILIGVLTCISSIAPRNLFDLILYAAFGLAVSASIVLLFGPYYRRGWLAMLWIAFFWIFMLPIMLLSGTVILWILKILR